MLNSELNQRDHYRKSFEKQRDTIVFHSIVMGVQYLQETYQIL